MNEKQIEKTIWILVVFSILANFLDFITTIIGFSKGFDEKTLLPKLLLEISPYLFAFVKLIIFPFIIIISVLFLLWFKKMLFSKKIDLRNFTNFSTIILLIWVFIYFLNLGIKNIILIWP